MKICPYPIIAACAFSVSVCWGHTSDGAAEQRTYDFKISVDGNDIVVRGVRCTNFGGVDDKEDDGNTEGNVSLRENGKDKPIDGCALPMQTYTELGYSGADTSSSPIPALPYKKTKVAVTYHGKTIIVPLIERGPSPDAASHAVIDLTNFSFLKFAKLEEGILYDVDFRIIGAAKYLKVPYVPPRPEDL
jgi:hypothetical protein